MSACEATSWSDEEDASRWVMRACEWWSVSGVSSPVVARVEWSLASLASRARGLVVLVVRVEETSARVVALGVVVGGHLGHDVRGALAMGVDGVAARVMAAWRASALASRTLVVVS